VKLVLLVGFMTKKFVTMYGHMNLKNQHQSALLCAFLRNFTVFMVIMTVLFHVISTVQPHINKYRILHLRKNKLFPLQRKIIKPSVRKKTAL